MSTKTAQQRPGTAILRCYQAGPFVQELQSFLRARDAKDTVPGAIIRLCEDVFGALANWLERAGWVGGFADRPVMLDQVGRVLDQLAARKRLGDAQDQLERGSLVARYLIVLVAMGVDVEEVHLVQSATLDAADVRLPRYWARPPWLGHAIWRLVGREDCLRFLGDYRRFWSLEPRSRRRRSRQPHIAPDTFSRQAHEIGFNIPSQRQIRRSKFVRDDTEDGPVVISLRHNQARGHASTLAYCDQILPDHTYLQMGVRLLQFSLSIREVEKEDEQLLCSLVLSQLSLMYGLTFEDAFKMGFDEQAEADTGWINVKYGILNLRIGYDHGKALFGRIPPQIVRLPLLPLAGRIIECIQSKGVKNLGEVYRSNRIDQVSSDLKNFARLDESCRLRLKRLWEGWQYIALRRVRLQPGVLALLSGYVVGPYRAESSYLTVTERILFEAVSRIHSEVYRFAGLGVQFEYKSSSPETRVGKCTPTLAEVADSALLTLTKIEGQNDLRAACHWLFLTHGRRSNGELPHPRAHLLGLPEGYLLYVADKDLGGGRRVRLLPVAESAVKAILPLL